MASGAPGSGPLLAMPMLVMNMGSEMVYILEQRLQAQNIPTEKSRKVLTDVVRTMYSPKFIAELFKPQQVYSNRSTRQIFDRLAHSSIMRLNENSMDKLYDLMTMGFKYQILCSTGPNELLQVTLNHLEALKRIVENKAVTDLIDNAMRLSVNAYSTLPPGEAFALKHTLCRFFQDRRVKVSLFLQDGIQNLDGTIVLDMRGPVPVGSELPGTVRYFDEGGAVVSTTTLAPLEVEGAVAPKTGDPMDPDTRPCKLGANLYAKPRKTGGSAPKPGPDAARHAKGGSGKAKAKAAAASEGKGAETAAPKPKGKGAGESADGAKTATAGLNMLASLLGTAAADSESKSAGGGGGGGAAGTFKLSLFAEDPFGGGGGGEGGEARSEVIMIDARDRESLEDMMRKLDMGDGGGGGSGGGGGRAEGKSGEDEDDLLALMDSAN